ELALRGAGLPGVAAVLPGGRERHHARRPARDPARGGRGAGGRDAGGRRVIYGDTASLFVDAGEPDSARAAVRGEALRDEVGGEVAAALAREFDCTRHLEVEFEED